MIRRFAAAGAVLAAVSLSVATIAVRPVIAQQAPQAPAAKLPSDQELDALLAARNWNALGTALKSANDPTSFKRGLDWLSTRLISGGGSFLGFAYAQRLWAIGNALKVEDADHDLRVTAGAIVLYTYELIVIDGAKCADRTAPSHRADQLFMNNGPVLAYLKAKPDPVKARVVDAAIAFEKGTTPRRKDDDLLCRDGMEQMKAGLAAGLTHDVPTDKGFPGKTVAVEAPPGYTPRFLPPETYKPVQGRARAEMRARLTKLIQ